MINPASPLAAYNKVAGQSLEKSTEGSSTSFGDFVKNAVSSTVESLHTMEQASQQAMTGQISDLSLVTAVNEAEIQLQAFKTILEKSLQQYSQIVDKTNL